MPKPPDIVFFDVGNILVSDDPSACYVYRQLYLARGGEAWVSPTEFFRQREQALAAGLGMWQFIRQELPPGVDYHDFQTRVRKAIYSNWAHYSPEIPQMRETMRVLAGMHRLGIIANQPCAIEQVLSERELWDCFAVRAISAALGVDKPNPGIFAWALEEAGVQAADTIMVGDRIDNDIRPAKALGMRTLWFSLSFEQRGWAPGDDFEQAYAASVIRNGWSHTPPRNAQEQPDQEAHSPGELVAALSR